MVTARDADDLDGPVATIPLRADTDPVADRLRVATWNMWYDATRVRNGDDKVIRALLEENIDLVALQRSTAIRSPGPSDGSPNGWASGVGLWSGADVPVAPGRVAFDRRVG
ncbi:hypothetical protein ACQEU8_07200 [Streptomyces sp. CA-250714]|uniref:hypothetical protein n=1 Tax=Streptomyces sp. CA-250714 TaxID=3240060 RepID=UPI003D931C59